MDEQTLTRVLCKVLDDRKRVDDATHKAHHDYIALCLKREERRERIRTKVQTHVLGWGVVMFIGGITYAFGEGVKQLVANSLKAIQGGP